MAIDFGGSLGTSIAQARSQHLLRIQVQFNMEESSNISESLTAKSDQINDIVASRPEETNVKKEDGFGDEKKLLIGEETQEQKDAQNERLQVDNTTDMSNPVSSEEKSELGETSTQDLNGVETDENPTTKTPNLNALASEKNENLLSSNSEGDIASNTSARLDQLSSQEADSELTNGQSESTVSSKNCSESSAVEGGSHRSPDRKSKVEYRKIKSEVTGEGETSESEGEENNKDVAENDLQSTEHDDDQLKDTSMDILGNGLLKKRVITLSVL